MFSLVSRIFRSKPLSWERGRHGESVAVRHIKKEGMKVVARNWRARTKGIRGEIDIVARDGEVLVFLEVKSRQASSQQNAGYYSVTSKKKDTLEPTCLAFMRERGLRGMSYRFDIIEVRLCQEGKDTVQHYTNVKLFNRKRPQNR